MTAIGFEVRTARKRHSCEWCGEETVPGEKYETWAWVYDGVYRVRIHPECNEAWRRAIDDKVMDRHDGISFGEFSRGCYCERGVCECPKETQTDD